MRRKFQLLRSARLIPEVNLLKGLDEIRQANRLAETKYKRKSWLASGAYLGWAVMWILFADDLMLALGSSDSGHATMLMVIANFAGVFWLHNYALRKPFQQAAREILQKRGVPICVGCGYDLRGQAEARCPECGRPFDDDLLKHGATGRPDGEPADEAPR